MKIAAKKHRIHVREEFYCMQHHNFCPRIFLVNIVSSKIRSLLNLSAVGDEVTTIGNKSIITIMDHKIAI